MTDPIKADVSKTVADAKGAVDGEVNTLRARVNAAEVKTDAAWKLHKWFLIGGLIVGLALGIILAHVL